MNHNGLMEDPRNFSEVCIDAMSALVSHGHSFDNARLLAYYPAIRQNPFQKMLYASAFENGFAVTPLPSLDAVDALSDRMQITLHYHWIHDVFKRLGKAREAKKAAKGFIEQVHRQREAGHKILWTIHNVLSHSATFIDEEVFLRQEMAKLSDMIHIMNPETPKLVKGHYELSSDKIIHIPHPSYTNVYGDYISRAQARLELGLNEDNVAFLCFGSLVPYKGTRFFIQVLDRLQERFEGRARLIIAGSKGKADFMEELYRIISGRSDIILYADHVDDQALQVFFRATDVVACPYPVSLNSGVAMTAATFGKPMIVPEMLLPSFNTLPIGATSFTPNDLESCVHAANEAANIALGKADADGGVPDITAWAAARDSLTVSKDFFRALRAFRGEGTGDIAPNGFQADFAGAGA
ncbi:glycosyltransferase [Kordiimonas sp. SCSIO 12610]|uniref:glycosyltransferase n=1 Tax=Kordiimonas sp. SCSIO 12610 TaxID=2829597 RepID=UPI002108E0BA|nr:glycosyltransferase [Kordiimonas sp. SCSIO 12610]UTW56275.1 glycosyltransferase family 4 protein [Kordiimonas sp. SCSIO 12610]